MEKKVIQKNLIRDCLPTVFSLMLSGLYSVMDGLFVGRAAGDTGLAAVNLAWPLVAVITATGIGIGSGGSVLFSNLAGKDEKQESEKTYHLTVCLLVGVGILLSVILFLTYPILLQLLCADYYFRMCFSDHRFRNDTVASKQRDGSQRYGEYGHRDVRKSCIELCIHF